MLHQRYKDVCFLAISKATVPNYWIRKWRYAAGSVAARPLHVHLGCGPKYLPGFVNVDANPLQKIDMWLDVRCGLPFANQSVDSIYSTHMIEHLYPDELEDLLRECARVLKPRAGLRLIVPSLRSAVLAYQENRHDWFCDSFPRHFDSVGGRFSNFVFCDGQHRTAFDFGYLQEVLAKSGLREVREFAEGQSRLYGPHAPPFEPDDGAGLPHSLYVEAFK
ncbi:MAG TPA: methyltransferase domain-containing protein [Terriglobales bacterium]|nr:methyltransferase domain-containing protein [Terriglobales bacterium]